MMGMEGKFQFQFQFQFSPYRNIYNRYYAIKSRMQGFTVVKLCDASLIWCSHHVLTRDRKRAPVNFPNCWKRSISLANTSVQCNLCCWKSGITGESKKWSKAWLFFTKRDDISIGYMLKYFSNLQNYLYVLLGARECYSYGFPAEQHLCHWW